MFSSANCYNIDFQPNFKEKENQRTTDQTRTCKPKLSHLIKEDVS